MLIQRTKILSLGQSTRTSNEETEIAHACLPSQRSYTPSHLPKDRIWPRPARMHAESSDCNHPIRRLAAFPAHPPSEMLINRRSYQTSMDGSFVTYPALGILLFFLDVFQPVLHSRPFGDQVVCESNREGLPKCKENIMTRDAPADKKFDG